MQELPNDYEQQSIENDDSSHFTCPIEDGQENRKGRRRYVVPGRRLTCLFQIHGKWDIDIITKHSTVSLKYKTCIYVVFRFVRHIFSSARRFPR
jgi:hypothetical protein